MARRKPTLTLLVDEDWIYALSALTAESNLLSKHTDKIHLIHYTILDDEVGRCFVTELIAAKVEADAAEKEPGEDWTDAIHLKYLEFLDKDDFRAWYAKSLEYLVTQYGSGDLKADGLVSYERALPDNRGVVQNVSAKVRKERTDFIVSHLEQLRIRFIEHVVKPNILLFNCLKNKFGTEPDAVQSQKLDTLSTVVGMDDTPPSLFSERPIINIEINQPDEADQHVYQYNASPIDGSFAVDYSQDITAEGEQVSLVITNIEGHQFQEHEYEIENYHDSQFIKVYILDYTTVANLTGTIRIRVLS